MAGVTGLEPAASGVTGQRSNQLSYTPAFRSAVARSLAGGDHLLSHLAGVKRARAPGPLFSSPAPIIGPRGLRAGIRARIAEVPTLPRSSMES